MGFIIPEIAVESADKLWNLITIALENPAIMFKSIRVKDLGIFLERDPELSCIDTIIKKGLGEGAMTDQLWESRIKEHIQDVFNGNTKQTYILSKFVVDARF